MGATVEVLKSLFAGVYFERLRKGLANIVTVSSFKTQIEAEFNVLF